MMLLTRASEGSPSDRADALREIRILAERRDTAHCWATYALAVVREQDESLRLFDHLHDRFPDSNIVGVARILSQAALSDRAEGTTRHRR
jgi:hypothetical protein